MVRVFARRLCQGNFLFRQGPYGYVVGLGLPVIAAQANSACLVLQVLKGADLLAIDKEQERILVSKHLQGIGLTEFNIIGLFPKPCPAAVGFAVLCAFQPDAKVVTMVIIGAGAFLCRTNQYACIAGIYAILPQRDFRFQSEVAPCFVACNQLIVESLGYVNLSIGDLDVLFIAHFCPARRGSFGVFEIFAQIRLHIGRVLNGAVKFFIFQVIYPLGGEGGVLRQIVLVDGILVVYSFRRIDNGAALNRDFPLVCFHPRIGVDALCLHRKVQINRIAVIPDAVQDDVALFIRFCGNLFPIDREGVSVGCPGRNTQAIGEFRRLVHFHGDGGRPLPRHIGLCMQANRIFTEIDGCIVVDIEVLGNHIALLGIDIAAQRLHRTHQVRRAACRAEPL